MKRHFRLRKPLFFPLNYGDRTISDFRSLIADFKCKRENSELFYCGRQPKRDDSGRAFEPGLISTGESVVESFLSGERV